MAVRYQPAGDPMVRVSAFPSSAAAATLHPVDLEDTVACQAFLRAVAADSAFVEAMECASPAAAEALRKALTQPVESKRLRRTVLTITRYLLRAATRATPFGLFAGVAPARFESAGFESAGFESAGFGGAGFGAGPRVGFGDAGHRRAVRPDFGALAEQVALLERDPAVLPTLRLMANNLCMVRGDRLVLPYVRQPGHDGPARELSVRNTAAVRAAFELAVTPIRYEALIEALTTRFPQAPAEGFATLLRTMVERELLLTDLRPPLESPDPLTHVTSRVSADLRPMRAQVDLRVDVEVVLPEEVGLEAARAIEVLCHTSPDSPVVKSLWDYHEEFVERYGLGRLVPLKDLLDPGRGLGPPAGYRNPAGHRRRETNRRLISRERDQVLGTLVQKSLLEGTQEVLLTDALVEQIAPTAPDRSPTSIEVNVGLVTDDNLTTLSNGDFQLVLGPMPGLRHVGALAGRFGHLLDGSDPLPATPPSTLPVQLSFAPYAERAANVSQVPRRLDTLLPIGVFDHGGETLALDDIAIGSDGDRLFAWSLSRAIEIWPLALHMLDEDSSAPNAARFLRELPLLAEHPCLPWIWGGLEALPYLPRVRYGRTILAPARWRPDPKLLDQGPYAQWLEHFTQWRATWRLPRVIEATVADNRVTLDLDAPLHLRVLRDELLRHKDLILYEHFDAQLEGYAAEVVIPLICKTPPKSDHPTVAPLRSTDETRPAGSGWLYAKVYAPADRLDEVLAEHVPALLDESDPECWFFVRYEDRHGAHLRLRLRKAPPEFFSDWAARLRSIGLVNTFTLDSYDPELERYGGPEVMRLAEDAFCADSARTIDSIRALRSGAIDLPRELLVASEMYAILQNLGGPDLDDWLLSHVPKNPVHHKAFQHHKAAALSLIGARTPLPELPAFRLYGEKLRGLGSSSWTPFGVVRASLLHMHHNRLIGIDRKSEARTLAVMRGAIAAHRDRAEAEMRSEAQA